MSTIIHHILHLDQTLSGWVLHFGRWAYALLFFVIFAETGFVVMPFLPGDSLLLVAGVLASKHLLSMWVLLPLLACAGILGNTCNYSIGRWLGPKMFHSKRSRWFNPKYLHQANDVYQHHGALAIVLARFLPLVRTFAPFVAGLARMDFKRFSLFNAIGCTLWAIPFLSIGFFFGNLPFVKNYLSLTIAIIVMLSLVPALIGLIRSRRKKNKT